MPLGEDDIERLFAQREEIDRALTERHSRELAVMFTDIVGSTQYFEQKGDIAGLQLIRRHNDLLFPVVATHRGRIIKTIGDAIMAVFDDPHDLIRCAMAMHRALEADKTGHRIHVRIGGHHGRVFTTENDVFGDTVNTAARVAHEAHGDEILVSDALLQKIPDRTGVAAVPRGALPLKGKAEPLPVVAIRWNDAIPLAATHDERARSEPPAKAPAAVEQDQLFVLELQVASEGLKVVAIDGSADKGTVKAYAEVSLPRAQLDDMAHRFGTFMHRGGAESYVQRIREQGAELFARSLSERARKHLIETSCRFLRLQLDDELVHVPWELSYDGKDFLALRFALGRVVVARSETAPALQLAAGHPGPALVLSNASGDLPAADQEGEAVAGLLQEGFAAGVRHLKGPVKCADFLSALPGCALLHVAGHADQPRGRDPGGFVLADGRVTPEQLTAAVGPAAPPVVFANSCHASTGLGFVERARGVSDLASAFLMRGTQHYIGPMWDVADEDALTFALRFYESALRGTPLGEAARGARQELARSSRQPLSFAGYVLYGEPRTALRAGLRGPAAVRSRAQPVVGTPPARPTHGPPRRRSKALPLILGGVAAAVLAGGTVLYVTAPKPSGTLPVPVAPAHPAQAAPLRVPHTGPLRICVFPFKAVGGDDMKLGDAFQEAVYTDFGQDASVKLIERGQIDLDVGEIDFEAKYADPSTRAALGKLIGAELALLGGYQRTGQSVRVFARFVDVESGEVVHGFKLDGPDSDAFALEERVAAGAREAIGPLKRKLRP